MGHLTWLLKLLKLLWLKPQRLHLSKLLGRISRYPLILGRWPALLSLRNEEGVLVAHVAGAGSVLKLLAFLQVLLRELQIGN
jgi:hypothetical protein